MSLALKQTGTRPLHGRPDMAADPALHDPDSGPRLLCRACGHEITRAGARTSVDGSHRHVFSNPHGHVFEIGCFSRAPGCLCKGPATTEFTWFPGHAWRIALCGGCGGLMGWRYEATSGGGNSFFGLILPHLVEEDTRQGPA